jgi:hypothetical protein
MTEQAWLECTDPAPMLEFLSSKANKRKTLCFSTACCRRVQSLLTVYGEGILSTLERAADIPLPPAELDSLANDALAHTDGLSYHMGTPAGCAQWLASYAVFHAAEGNATGASLDAARAIECSRADPAHFNIRTPAPPSPGDPVERGLQTSLLRCVFGNPFRKTRVQQKWLEWNDGVIAKIAQAIYDEASFTSLLVLADALEEAGCTDADILGHCRKSEPHARGCWVIDRIVDKG